MTKAFDRLLLGGLLGAVLFCVAAPQAAAQSQAPAWPTKPIIFVVPFAPGGGTDAFARPLAAQLDGQLGQRVLIENKAGAGGTVGASHAAKQPADGYTFFVGAAHHTIAPSLYTKLDYSIEDSFIPIAIIARPPQIVSVNPKRIEAKTLGEFITYAKANPEKITYGSAGVGTTHHLTGELFKTLTGTSLRHVSYRGAGPAMADLVAGHVDMMFDGLGTSATQINGGTLRGLALAAPQRSTTLPDVPTTGESGLKNFEVSTWYALWAPKGTPQPIVDRMIKEVRTAMQTPVLKDAWQRNGSDVPDVTGPEFGKFVTSEIARWRKVVADGNIKLD